MEMESTDFLILCIAEELRRAIRIQEIPGVEECMM